MAIIVADRVLETSTTVGTGAYTLGGAVTGYRAAGAVCANGDTFTYYADDVDAYGRSLGAWETGLGTWGTGGILTRTTIYSSSNANAAVSWAAGTRRIALALVASNATLGPISNPSLIGSVTVDSYIAKTNGTAPAVWLSQDGSGRQHWYWNSWGGVVPTFAVAGEDASDVMQHVSNAGSGGSFTHRSASGVGKAAGDPITWVNTIYSDLSSFTWKGNTVWHSGNDGTGSVLDADLLDGQHGSFYQSASNLNSGSLPANVIPSFLYSSGSTDGSYISNGLYYGAAAWRHLDVNSYGYVLRNSGTQGAQLFVASTAGTVDSVATMVSYTFKPNGYVNAVGYESTVATGTAPFTVASTTLVSNLNADLLDGLNSTSFVRSNTSNTFSSGILTVSNTPGVLGTSLAAENTIQIYQATTGTDAFQTFHIAGDTAVHFGLDGTTNDLFVGGWSKGAVKYKIWHAGNDGSGSGLDADLLDGQHGSYYAPISNPTFTNPTNSIVTSQGTSGFGSFYAKGSGINNSYMFFGNVTNGEQGRITSDSTGLYFATLAGASTQFKVENTASTVNYITVTGSSADQPPKLLTSGTDTNIGLNITPKGTGVVTIGGGGTHFTSSDVKFKTGTGSTGYSVIARNDGANFYLLQTASGDALGSWNTFRPFAFNLANGIVNMGEGVTISGGLTSYAIGTPATPTGTPSTTGGTIPATTTFAKIVGVDSMGNTTPASTQSAVVTTTTATSSIIWNWTALAGAKSYRIYVGATGVNGNYFTSTTNTFTQTLPSSSGTAATPPTTNTTGSISAPFFNGGTYSTSDRRAKDNIRSLEYGLKDIIKLMPKKFDMKKDGSTSIGLIAQEVNEIIPEVVAQISDEYLGINYSLLVSVLINAVKELKEEIEELKLNIK